MSINTTNYNLVKPTDADNINIVDINGNMDIIDGVLKGHDTQLSDLTYQVATGTSTAITLTMQTLVNGYAKTFIASANNNGSATTINGKPLYKPNTTTAPNLIVEKAYTVWYNSTGGCFFIKASAEGDALAKDVRKNTTFSNDSDSGLLGGLDLSLLIPGNLRAGIIIDGVTGAANIVDTTISSSAATAVMIRTGYKCFINGVLTIGTAPEKAATTITPGTTDQTIASGVITTGVQTIKGDANLLAANIISGKSIFGVAGAATPTTLGGLSKVASGSYTGGSVNNLNDGTIPTSLFGAASFVRGSTLLNLSDGATATKNFWAVYTGSVWHCIYLENGTSDIDLQQNATTFIKVFNLPNSTYTKTVTSYVTTYYCYN